MGAKTLFVVGAGASCELGFPSGPKLLAEIADALDIRFDVNQIAGDPVIWDQLRRIQQRDQPGTDVNVYRQAACRVSAAARAGRSIDTVMDQHDDEPNVKLAGKLGIVRRILKAERNSCLGSGIGQEDMIWSRLLKTWLVSFVQIATAGSRRSDLSALFADITVVCFNYDRTLEMFLPMALERVYGLPRQEAETLAGRLRIIHPYGSLGDMPWTNGGATVLPFGQDTTDLEPISRRIRTFTEQLEDSALKTSITNASTVADRIVFLGFGFHPQNVALLKPDIPTNPKIFGTVYKMPTPAVSAAAEMVGEAFGTGQSTAYQMQIDALADQECSQFLEDRFLPLTA